ncbi:YopX family protein [Heyndrickxia coagulans]|uniref:YopX family protein n=1 Tax=Heyndrickxia coagulans TaxID=1398 RepID=UPI002E24674B|nr:YopX family protein [Heyndrickxia coagulans]
MREIKLRAWDEELKRMFYGTTEQFDDSLSFRFKHFETDEPVYMQYTGLCDKNDREIYEGNILEAEHKLNTQKFMRKYQVIFNERGYWDAISLDDKPVRLCYAGFDKCKAIGNIYENPELVK